MSASSTAPERKSVAPGHDALVVNQFGSQAAAYVASATHAQGDDILQLAALAAMVPQARVLDMGCGGGHVSYAVAKNAASVVAYDLSSEMLAAVRAEAAKRGLANIETAKGPAEQVPFADGSFDAVVCRYTTHHWHDAARGLREARRVLKAGGVAAFADVIAPESAVADTFLQAFEMLRDPSHVRDYTTAEWVDMAGRAGFAVTAVTRRRLHLDFSAWIGRMRTPLVFVEAIRALQAAMAPEVQAYFEIEEDGTFTIDTATFELRAV